MLDILEKYYQDGLLYKQKHPYLDLWIWNYSVSVQYENLWDEITAQCRGLVTNSKGEIVARPFKKFKNFEEYELSDIPNESFEVFEKMDGSLGILFYYETELSYQERYKIWFNNNYETGFEFNQNKIVDFDEPYWTPTPKTKGEWIMATRGSFISDQAIKGFEMLKKYDYERLHKNYTYLFEIIYFQNRIVIQYDFEDLVLLSMIETETGEEYNGEIRLLNMIENVGFKIVKKYDGINDYRTLKTIISNDAEGFVIRFKNGFRMKIKGEEYCRLHRILTNISSRNIWEYLKDDKPFDKILEKVPDEFYNWVKETIKNFQNKHQEILGIVIEDYWEIDKLLSEELISLGNQGIVYDEKQLSKRYAEEAFKKRYPHLLFTYRKEILNPIRTTKAIWNMLYPDFVKPFKNDE